MILYKIRKKCYKNAIQTTLIYSACSKSIISTLNFLNLKIGLYLCKRMSWFLGDLLKFLGVKDHDLSRWFTNNRRTIMIISIIYIRRVITQNGIWWIWAKHLWELIISVLHLFWKLNIFSKYDLKRHYSSGKNMPSKRPV